MSDVTYHVIDHIVTVNIRGRRPTGEHEAVSDALARWAEIARLARQPGVAGVLVVIELTGALPSQRALKVASSVAALGLPRSVPIALVNQDPDSFGQTTFGARLAASRGWLSMAFPTLAEAQAWLQADRLEQLRSVRRPLALRGERLPLVVRDMVRDAAEHALDTDAALQSIAHVIALQTGSSRLCIWRVEPGPDAIRLAAGVDADFAPLASPPAPDDWRSASDALARLQAAPEAAEGAEPGPSPAELLAPLVDPGSDRLLGLLACTCAAGRHWQPDELAQLRACAREMGPLLVRGH